MTDDEPLRDVVDAWRRADPDGTRTSQVVRNTFDQLYDGQRTGRYRVDQLSKTEKTHFGSLVEINLRREFSDILEDGKKLDFSVAGHEIDCKFSFRDGGWMLPPECFDELILVLTASDERSTWSLGVVRATTENRRVGGNRDMKSSLNTVGNSAVHWIVRQGELPTNALLQASDEDRSAIMAGRSGQQRVLQLFRRVQLVPISRVVIATVAQQDDYMKRVRYNGGARSLLQPEGFLIPGGDYEVHRRLALDLGAPDIEPGEFVSFRVVPAEADALQTALLEGRRWRIAEPGEPTVEAAPKLPTTVKGD